ncbi:MAG: kinase-like domain-containing protein [Monoraphidium minutum]|nr:MAG: kinase-like domain-containing protein [Monoraphidium minutum]
MQFFGGGSSERRSVRQTLLVTRHCPLEMRARSNWSIDQFVVAKKLGGGYASTVHLAVCKTTGIQVAVKIYHRVKLSQLNQYQVKREVRIHSCLDHPNVLKLYAAFEDEVGVYLVTEFASRGDVFGELDRRGGTMPEGDAVTQVLQPFMSALRYLHALNIIHRDIKPENLLMNAAGELKVADFGLSIDITQERPVTRVGTLDYMAPEVVVCPDKCLPSDNKEKTHLHYTRLVDAWAVGVLAYELTVGRAPFDAGNKRATIDRILNGAPAYPSWLSEQARHFISWSLTKDVATRPDIHELAYHPWITGHAAKARPRISPGRAASAADLLAPAPGSDNRAHMEARHKALAAGHVGGVNGGGAELPASGSGDEEGSSEEPEVTAAVTTPSGDARQPASPFAAKQLQRPPPTPTAAGGAGTAAPGGGAAKGLFESAADSLRAYVHRCQSANNLDSLRAAVLMQPPEPSNACFEPGGRFHNPKAPLTPLTPPPLAAARAGGAVPVTAVSAPPAAAAAAAAQPQQQAQQQQAQQQQAQQPRVVPCDSVTSMASGGAASPKPGGAAGAPPRPPALQLVRLPSPGLATHSAAPAGTPAAGGGAAPPSPARSLSPMAVTPECGAAPRVQLFSPHKGAAPGGRAPSTPARCCGGSVCRSSGASMTEMMQVDSSQISSGAGDSDGSSCGSAAEYVSVCSGGGALGRPRVGPGGGHHHHHAAAAGRAALLAPEPMSPPHGFAAKGAAVAPAPAVGGAPEAPRGAQQPEGAPGAPAGAGAGGASAQAGWFGLQCFLRPNKA